ncbi:MAG: ArdC family protein [Planctomycetota bacterium]|nr:ArdC family protein [Planctomycetota bacterium]
MPDDSSHSLTAHALAQLELALQAGKSGTLRRLLGAMARFHDYSASNVMLIHSQRPDSTQVAGFNTWRKLGRFVKKGERGIVIYAPIRSKRDAAASPDEETVRFRAVRVFDISQTDGENLPEPAPVTGDPCDQLQRLREVIAAYGVTVEHAALRPGHHGSSTGGHIIIASGLSAAEEFATLVHEFAHELMHQRGDRPSSKTVRETEAEAVAFVVGHVIGLDIEDASRDYIQLYDGNAETLSASLSRIQKTSREIVNALLQPQTALATAA